MVAACASKTQKSSGRNIPTAAARRRFPRMTIPARWIGPATGAMAHVAQWSTNFMKNAATSCFSSSFLLSAPDRLVVVSFSFFSFLLYFFVSILVDCYVSFSSVLFLIFLFLSFSFLFLFLFLLFFLICSHSGYVMFYLLASITWHFLSYDFYFSYFFVYLWLFLFYLVLVILNLS